MKFSKEVIMGAGLGVLVGALVILGIRFVSYRPAHTHYHANFVVYINGQREVFNSPFYYEESGAGACTADADITPAQRAHMHDNVHDVVHVHDNAVTWGHFFQNLGWTVNDHVIQTPDAIYTPDATHKINFMIDGRTYQDVSNELINDKARLLVDFGNTSEATLQKEMQSVATTAAKYDAGTDPKTCQSNAAPTMTDRLRHLF